MEWAAFIIISELQGIPRCFESAQTIDTRHLYVINNFFSRFFTAVNSLLAGIPPFPFWLWLLLQGQFWSVPLVTETDLLTHNTGSLGKGAGKCLVCEGSCWSCAECPKHHRQFSSHCVRQRFRSKKRMEKWVTRFAGVMASTEGSPNWQRLHRSKKKRWKLDMATIYNIKRGMEKVTRNKDAQSHGNINQNDHLMDSKTNEWGHVFCC